MNEKDLPLMLRKLANTTELPASQRIVFLTLLEPDLTNQEIADRLGVSHPTVCYSLKKLYRLGLAKRVRPTDPASSRWSMKYILPTIREVFFSA